MEHIYEGVLHQVGRPDQVFFDFLVFGVVEYQVLGRHVNVGGEVHFFVDIPHAGKVFVVVDGQLLGGQELGKFVLKILQVRLDFLHEEGVLCQSAHELLLLGKIEHGIVHLQGFLHTFIDLLGGQLSQHVEALLDGHALLGTREGLEFRPVDNEGESYQLAHELLKVETTLLDEHKILVADGLFWGHGRDGDTGPSFGDALEQKEELVEAAEAVPFALVVHAVDLIDDVTTRIVRVLDRVLHGMVVVAVLVAGLDAFGTVSLCLVDGSVSHQFLIICSSSNDSLHIACFDHV